MDETTTPFGKLLRVLAAVILVVSLTPSPSFADSGNSQSDSDSASAAAASSNALSDSEGATTRQTDGASMTAQSVEVALGQDNDGAIATTQSDDTEPPVVDMTSLSVSPATATAGQTVTVSAKITDNAGVSFCWITYKNETKGAEKTIFLYDKDGDSVFTGEFEVVDSTISGTWGAVSLITSDTQHNRTSLTPSNTDLSALSFEVTGTTGDSEPPVVDAASLSVTPAKASAGEAVTVSAKITDNIGVSECEVSYKNATDGHVKTVYLSDRDGDGVYTGQFKVTTSTSLGVWAAESLLAKDDGGNECTLTSSDTDLSALTFEVVEADDTEAPAIDAASLSASPAKVSAGQTVTVSAKATDNVGVSECSVSYKNETAGTTETVSLKDEDGDGVFTGQFEVTESTASGTWAASSLSASDAKGNKSELNSSDTDLSALTFEVSETAVDNEPPSFDVTSFSASPATATAGQTVTISAKVADNVGVKYCFAWYKNASGGSFKSISLRDKDGDGVFTGQFEVTESTASGTWAVERIYAKDAEGNTCTLKPSDTDLSTLSFEVVVTDDTEAPVVDTTSFSVTPAKASAGETVTVSAKATDNVGVSECSVSYKNETAGTTETVSLKDEDGDGVFTGQFEVTESTASGTWAASEVYASDVKGNKCDLTSSDTDLSALTFEVAEKVVDTEPPTIDTTSFSVAPARAMPGETVTISAKVTDNVGVTTCSVTYINATGGIVQKVSLTDEDGDGVFTGQLEITESTTVGTWSVHLFSVRDSLGNTRDMWPSDTDLSALSFEVVGKDITSATISDIPDQAYTGEALTPAFTVTLDGEELVEGTDYTVAYTDNTNAGTATVTVTGTGKYAGTITRTFDIAAADLSAATVTSTDQTYSGEALTPAVIVTLGDKALVENTDYTVAYADNTGIGTATVTVTGTGNYTGTATGSFTIAAADLSAATVSAADQTYTGEALTPAVTVTLGTATLVEGTDYTVAYADNTGIGTATVTVTGTGNYTGTATGTFAIAPADLSAAVVSAGGQIYTGEALEPEVTVVLDGTTLVEGTDYTVAYADNTTAGTATVTVTGMGNYTGTATGNFEIVNPRYHVIKSASIEHGTVTLIDSADGTKATLWPHAGDTVTFRTSPDTGYTLTRMSYTYTDPTTGQTVTKALKRISGTGRAGTNSVYSFTMPAADVTLNASFAENHRTIHKQIDGQGVLIIQQQADGSRATLYPQPGDRVRFKAIPARGNKLTNIYYTVEGQTKRLALTRVEGTTNVYEFTMPNWNVTLHAVFVER
jgi:hypothetical protein